MSYLLEKINVPTLILVGEEDAITPVSDSQNMQRKIKNSQLQIIKNAAHMSNMENSKEFNNYLLNFVKKK